MHTLASKASAPVGRELLALHRGEDCVPLLMWQIGHFFVLLWQHLARDHDAIYQ